ncbi:MAG: sugar nucleotide-binding protein, partial [Deltaproteobacteria bacterium]|nr:sugar nucleotide-binding protein [Deltaproteobacteria bacterium]
MRMLITGVSGMLGNNLARYFRDSFSILGFYHQHPVTIQGVQARPLNLLEKSLLKRQIDLFAPDVVIHCASLTDLDFCEKNREMAFAINTETTHHLVESLKTSPAKFVFISSDAVYDGCRGEYTEEDAVSPSNVYGETKIEAEKIAAQRENSSILRTNIFGWNILSKLSLAEWFLSNLGKGNKVKGFHDVRFSALYTFTFARILEKVLKKNLKGL